MRNKIVRCSLFICLLFLSGCRRQGGEKAETGNNGKCYGAELLSGTSKIAEAPGGYYIQQGYSGSHILYADKESGSTIYLCAKPDCEHTGGKFGDVLETCDSFVGEAMSSSISYYEDYIYILLYNSETYDVSLARISKDGSVHETLFVIGKSPKATSGLFQYIIAGDSAFVISYPEELTEETPAEFSRWSLADGKKEVICQSTQERYVNLKLYANNLFYESCGTNRTDSKTSICRYNRSNQNTEVLFSAAIFGYTVNTATDQLLYWAIDEGLKGYDLKSGKTELIKKSDGTNMYAWPACNGRYIYIDNFMTQYYYDENAVHTVEVLDASDGHSIRTIQFPSDSWVMLEYCGDDSILAATFGDTGPGVSYIKNDDMEGKESVAWTGFVFPQ